MKAVYPGSFNPFTIGHKNIADRALQLFDKLIIAIGVNEDKPEGDVGANLQAIERIYMNEPRVQVVTYTGLTSDLCRLMGAKVLVRGVRDVKDFEYERPMAELNSRLFGLETILLYADPALTSVSSSAVRELTHYGADVSSLLPDLKPDK